ncbi:MAG: DUF192 domain-containing protein [Pseudomonadota bacterium]
MKEMVVMVACMRASALILMAGCEKLQTNSVNESATPEATAGQNTGSVAQAQLPGTNTSVATIVIKAASGDAPIAAEIAETDDERRNGLQNRESLAESSGMWFVFAQAGREKFWMKDTKIPLDLIFVGDDMKVVGFKENSVPESTELIESPADFRYVLEVNAGTVAKRGIKVGDAVEKRIGPK